MTGVFTHDFIFALFIPHIVLIFFLFISFRQLGHKGIETLLGIGAYIFIIQIGWYPIFATLTVWWMVIAIVTGFYFFIVGKIISPGKTSSVFQAGKSAGSWIKKKRTQGMSNAEIKQLAEKRRAQAIAENDNEAAKHWQEVINNL